MAISFGCERCGKAYKLDDSLAGKKAKCKQCGLEFRIPEPAMARSAEATIANDLYGLDEVEKAPLPPRYDDEFTGPKPKRVGYQPSSSRSKSAKQPFVAHEQLRSMGFGMLGFGVLVIVLPFIGLQHRALAQLPAGTQMIVGLLIASVGGVCLLMSHFGVLKSIAFGVVGFFGLVGLIVTASVGLPAANSARNAIVTAQATPAANPVPQPNPTNHAEAQPNPSPSPQPVGFQTPSPSPSEPQQQPGRPNQPQIKVKLSNARIWKEQNLRFPSKPIFSVDYKVEEGTGRGGLKYVWVIQTAGTRAKMDIFRIETQGRLEGSMFGPTAPAGPYECYLAIETFGIRGRDSIKVSDTVTFQEVGGPPNDAAPRGQPLLGGVPPANLAANGNSNNPGVGVAPAAPTPPASPQPASDDELTNLIADLKARDSFKARSAADTLAKQAPVEARRDEVVQTLLTLTNDRDGFTRNAGAAALAVWGSAKELDTWLQLLEDESFTVRWTAMAALGDLKDSKGAEAVARRFRADKIKATESLIKMGSVAETAVQPFLKDVEWSVRMDGCKILKSIGTKASLPMLNKALRDENGLVQMAAKEAVQSLGGTSGGAQTPRGKR